MTNALLATGLLAATMLVAPGVHAQSAAVNNPSFRTIPPPPINDPAYLVQAPLDYTQALGYLASTRIDSTRIDNRAFADAQGAIAINQAAGDGNQQANLRSVAIGDVAIASAVGRQSHADNQYDTPQHATASIGGNALAGASGLASINQASGSGNAELNLVAVTSASQGMGETTDEQLSSVASAPAGGQAPLPSSVAGTGTRSVAVESTALQGFGGLLQLNQVAGSGNATNNQFGLSVQPAP